jgi:WD40 repeat protein
MEPTPAPKIDPTQVRLVKEYKHDSPLIGCRFDPSGKFVFASAQDNSIQRWDLESGEKMAFAGHKSWVRALAFLPKEKQLISGCYAGQILAWPVDAAGPKPLRTTDAHKGWVRALAVNRDGTRFASCGNDGRVCIWNAADGALVREFTGHTCHVYNVAFHPTQPLVVSGDLKGQLKVWNLDKGTEERTLDASVLHKYDNTFKADIGGIRSMAFSEDGSLLACAGITDVTNAFAGVGKPVVVLFDFAAGKQKFLLRPRENFQGTSWGVVFHAGHIIGTGGGSGGALWFWKPDADKDVFTFKLPNNARDLDRHPDGKRLAIPFFDGVVRVYDISAKSP